ncbi:MAG: molybdate ABC transporter substrate-binding protein [Microbacterium sp.]
MRRRRAPVALAIALGLAALAGCAAQPDAEPAAPNDATPTPELSGTLTVFAAASLTEIFDALGEDFEQRHPSVEVVLNYGGSSALAQQIVAGAPADVFAAANESTMQTVVDADLADEPVAFATNALQLVVPADNPARVSGLADLARPELAIALCDPVVPCGAAAEKLLAAAGVEAAPDTLEEDVKAVLTKVLLGEADAGLVYVTDVRAAGDGVEGIVLDEADEAANPYPVAAIADGPSPDLGAAWIALLTGPAGRAALAEAGFGAP